MAYTKFPLQTVSSVPSTLIVNGESLLTGHIVAARLGDGEFISSSHEFLTPEEDARFVLRALGSSFARSEDATIYDLHTEAGTMTKRAYNELFVAVAHKLGAQGTADAISQCFSRGTFNVVRPLTTLPTGQLTEREHQVISLLSKGGTLAAGKYVHLTPIATELRLSSSRALDLKKQVLAKFRSNKNIFRAITAAYLAGVLPLESAED